MKIKNQKSRSKAKKIHIYRVIYSNQKQRHVTKLN